MTTKDLEFIILAKLPNGETRQVWIDPSLIKGFVMTVTTDTLKVSDKVLEGIEWPEEKDL